MKNVFIYTMICLPAAALIGCSPSVEQRIDDSIRANQAAVSSQEWDTSPNNPTAMFEEWRKMAANNPSKREDLSFKICDKLLALDGQSLSLFENEIENPENRGLVKTCYNRLMNKIEIYFENQHKSYPAPTPAPAPAPSKPKPTPSVPKTKVPETEPIVHSPHSTVHFTDNVLTKDYSSEPQIVSGKMDRKEVALTFDDGPSGAYTRSILKTLRKVNAKAHFFALGKSVKANPAILKEVAAEGHMIGSHTFSHYCIGGLRSCGKANGGQQISYAKAVAEINRGHQTVYNVLGWVDPIFRFPYGASTPQLRQYLKSQAIGDFFWSIDSLDWKAQSLDSLLNNTLRQVEKNQGGVVLFHDIQRRTAEILPRFLEELYHRGYSIVLLKSADPNARTNSRMVNLGEQVLASDTVIE